MSELESIDITKKVNEILIESPLREELLANVQYNNAHQIVLNDVYKMYKSDYYTEINIHYGVKSKTEYNHHDRVYDRKREILGYKIMQEQECYKKILSAQSEEEIERIQHEYQKNMKLIEARNEQFDHDEFIPYIYVEGKKRNALYGSIFSEISPRGTGGFKGIIGYRSPLSLFDKLQFTLETSGRNIKRFYNQYSLNWTQPLQKFTTDSREVYVGINHSNYPIFKGVDEGKSSINLGMSDQTSKIELQFAKRFPNIYENVTNAVLNDLHVPSTKLSVKKETTYKDTINFGEITTGQLREGKLEAGIPYLSNSSFLKYQYSFRKFWDIFSVSKYFNNLTLKTFFMNSNLEYNFSLKALLMKKNTISDLFQKLDVRGFENDRSYSHDKVQFKVGGKLNNYNFPLLGSIRVVPFLYAQAGVSWDGKMNDIKKRLYAVGSTGFGLSFALNKMVSLELVYSLLRAQNKPMKQPIPFQIRISVNE